MKEKIVLVQWIDSNSTHGWIDSEIVSTGDLPVCETVGFLINEDKDKVSILFGKSNYGSYFEKLDIPIGCVKSIRELIMKESKNG